MQWHDWQQQEQQQERHPPLFSEMTNIKHVSSKDMFQDFQRNMPAASGKQQQQQQLAPAAAGFVSAASLLHRGSTCDDKPAGKRATVSCKAARTSSASAYVLGSSRLGAWAAAAGKPPPAQALALHLAAADGSD
jgi:hypothetical protein